MNKKEKNTYEYPFRGVIDEYTFLIKDEFFRLVDETKISLKNILKVRFLINIIWIMMIVAIARGEWSSVFLGLLYVLGYIYARQMAGDYIFKKRKIWMWENKYKFKKPKLIEEIRNKDV